MISSSSSDDDDDDDDGNGNGNDDHDDDDEDESILQFLQCCKMKKDTFVKIVSVDRVVV